MCRLRNLYDTVISLHDHFEPDHRSLPCGYVSEEYLRMSWKERIDYLIHLHLPWYFNFVLSWREAARHIDICPVTYEEFFADQPGQLRRIAAFYGLTASDCADRGRHDTRQPGRHDWRFNVGVAGRGSEMLSAAQKQAIRDQGAICRIDISPCGSLAPLIVPRRAAA